METVGGRIQLEREHKGASVARAEWVPEWAGERGGREGLGNREEMRLDLF